MNSGVSKLGLPFAAGKVTVQMVRGGQMIIDRTPSDFTYVTNPVRYNYHATASLGGPASTLMTTTSTTTSSTSTTPILTSCYDDPTTSRVLYDGVSTSEATNTISECLTTCVNQGFAVGGV
ncbi:hypothetical protein EST38_g11113 [Candolleomyces aberdarensis]|uniref:Uncharacterized protein n=1 Tax=Candolleomyces aberdarensis TaxID=2316362 RepID=A0A4Q2D5P3_9AGAR|nr:hypothetical protein EST38_g11113 [Candolleomyces aberdarensis]